MAILAFPRRVDRVARPPSDRPATVKPFPTARHCRIVEFIANEMREKASPEAAEEHLVAHLQIECDRLAGMGVADDEIEHSCWQFAVAAWAAALRIDYDAEGAA